MPRALARVAIALAEAALSEAITSTLTPEAIMPSARVLNFCTSPWAFWMSGSRPASFMAFSSSGLSKPSHRAELAVSGRITPTLTPPPDGALPAELPPLPLELFSLLAPHADRARETPTPAARRARAVLRIPSSLPKPEMLRGTTYALKSRDGGHSPVPTGHGLATATPSAGHTRAPTVAVGQCRRVRLGGESLRLARFPGLQGGDPLLQ